MAGNLAKKRLFIPRAVRYKVNLRCQVKLFGSSDAINFNTIDMSESGISMITSKDIIPYNPSSILEITIPECDVVLVAKFVRKDYSRKGVFLAVSLIDPGENAKFSEFLLGLDTPDSGGYLREVENPGD